MFKLALKNCKKYSNAVVIGIKNFSNNEVRNIVGTYIIVNKEGWCLTSAYICNEILRIDAENKEYYEFEDKVNQQIFKYQKNKLINSQKEKKRMYLKRCIFLNAFDGGTIDSVIVHKTLPIGLIKWKNFSQDNSIKYPIFVKNDLFPGEYVCKYGFSFIESSAFEYDYRENKIIINKNSRFIVPYFVYPAMVTRNVLDKSGKLSFLELSTQNFAGLEGGPLINQAGEICGINAGTQGVPTGYSGTGFSTCMLGVAVSSSAIKKFMKENGVVFKEAK